MSTVSIPNVHAITLASTPARTERLSRHLYDRGIPWTPFEGIDAAEWGLCTKWRYNPSNLHVGQEVPQKHVGLHLSHYWLWRKFADSSEPVMTVLEDDAAFHDEWESEYRIAMESVPDDWDMLLLGSGHTSDKHRVKVAGNVWKVDGPACTHAYMIKRSALPVLLLTQKLSWAPIDASLVYRSYPHLKIYVVLPRIAYQHGQEYIVP